MNRNELKKLQKVINASLEIRPKTLERLYKSLGKNIEVVNIGDSINKNTSDYRLTLRDKNTGLLKEINYNTLIQNKNKLCSISDKNVESKTESNIDNMKISDILNIGNKKPIKVKETKTVDDTLNIRLDKETKKLLEEKSNGNVSEFCRNIIKDSLTDKQQNKIISNNNDEKYEVLTNMIKELAEKISNLSVNVSFSK